tara:strand:+ start:592 stop:855 length:264 start_codon:yes stop_codon:yes gene_type:complete
MSKPNMKKVFLIDDGDTLTKEMVTPAGIQKRSKWIKSCAKSAEEQPETWIAFGLFCIKQTWLRPESPEFWAKRGFVLLPDWDSSPNN